MDNAPQINTAPVAPEVVKSSNAEKPVVPADLKPGEGKEKVESKEPVKKEETRLATPAEKKKYKVKIDKEEKEVDEDELIRGYQMGSASNKRFEEATSLRKQNEEFIALLKDPEKAWEVLEKLGHNPKTLAEAKLAAALEDELLSDEQKEIRNLKRELEAERAEKKKHTEAKEKAEAEKVRSHWATEYQTKILETLEGSGLPKSPLAVKRMAYYLQQGLQRGLELEPKDIVHLVRQDYIDEQKELFGGLDADALLSIVGEDVATKIRKHELSKLKTPNQPFESNGAEKDVKPRNTKPKKMGSQEWRDHMEKLKANLT